MPKKKKGLPKTMPKGLAEFFGSLDDQYGPRLIPRLLDLPEFGHPDVIERYMNDLIPKVRAAEKTLAAARKAARELAEGIFRSCMENWTIKEMQEATGYDNT